MIGDYCIVRRRVAGVHCGTVREINGRAVTLTDARRIWSWQGRNTLSEISLRGVGDGSRVSEPVGRILLLEACEVIPCTPAARKVLEAVAWSR